MKTTESCTTTLIVRTFRLTTLDRGPVHSRRIGSLNVSAVGLGCNQLGTTCDQSASSAIVSKALDLGVTFFDTADEYGEGASERVLGRALQSNRSDVIIATKFGGPRGDIPLTGASPGRIRKSVEESLERLGTNYIDLYQLHFPDPNVPIADTLGALFELRASGKIREIGCANFTTAQLEEAGGAAAAAARVGFVSSQNRLSLLRQEALDQIGPHCLKFGLSLIPYFPLASGVLTGKYRRGKPPPPRSRLAENVSAVGVRKILSDSTFDRIEALSAFAVDRDRRLGDLAIAWLTSQALVGPVIAGATDPEQVEDNVKAAQWQLSVDEVALAAQLGRG